MSSLAVIIFCVIGNTSSPTPSPALMPPLPFASEMTFGIGHVVNLDIQSLEGSEKDIYPPDSFQTAIKTICCPWFSWLRHAAFIIGLPSISEMS